MPIPDNRGDWGVLGGSFDPVHNGHLNLAGAICIKKHLHGALIIPAYKHPLKKRAFVAPYADRIAMLKLALSGQNALQLCEIESEQRLSGYSYDTLQALKKRFPKAKIHFIIGSDLVPQLKSWHRADELIKEGSFLVGSRPGGEKSIDSTLPNTNFEFVEINELDISASDIRKRIKGGAPVDDIKQLVPKKVAEFIFKKGLYR